MEAQVQTHDARPAVMLLGLTGVGKSSLLHALSGKQMYEVDDGTRKSVKVMSEDIIRGSRIGDTANSTTKMANAIPIGEGAQQLLLIDTPGFADTEGHMDNILNAVSTARTMQLCSSLRIVMLIKQADVTDEKLGALVDLGKTISKLFADFSTASMSLAVWVVKPTEKIKEKRMEKMLKKACEQKTCQEAQRLLELMVQQLQRQPLRVIRYSKEGEGSDSEDSDDDASDDGVVVGAEEDRWVKVTFPTQELLGQLQGMVALQNPASHCLLPLSSDSSEYLRQLARDSRDRCEAAAELPDFAQMQHDMMVLKRISEHFKEVEQTTQAAPAAPGAGLADQVKTARKTVHAEYVNATIKAKERVDEQVTMRMEALRGALSEGNMNSPLDASVLDGFCWAVRCVAAAAEVNTHIKGLLSTETLQEQFSQLLTSLCEKAHSLVISDPAVQATLLKLAQMKAYFGGPLCARFIEMDIEFGAVGQMVQSSGDNLAHGITAQMQALHKEALAQLEEGVAAAAAARAPDACAQPSAFYDKAAAQLRTMREAQQRLVELVPQLATSYEGAKQAIGECLQP
jgi:GTPase Era involved in 16S rRNA processing